MASRAVKDDALLSEAHLRERKPSQVWVSVRNEKGEFEAIVEQKDASQEQRAIREVSMSTYVFDGRNLVPTLDQLQNDN